MNIEKLYPACKSIIWGGDKLKKYYGKKTDADPLAETWELSFHKDGLTCLEDGTPLSLVATESDLGENCKGFSFFPVLVKLIDADAKLSVQVHPADEYALKHENSLGKTEMWYIVDADEGAGIYLGFKENLTKEEFENAIADKTLTDYLQFIPVKAGKCYFIPAGTIHAICEGCLICEIQQNSNITYRVYDYGRKGADGKERELHVSKALDVTNTMKFIPKSLDVPTKEGILKGISRFFTATLVKVNGEKMLAKDEKSFRCFTCLSSEGSIGEVDITKGDSVFIPAGFENAILKGEFFGIMTTIRKYYIAVNLDSSYIRCEIVDDNSEIVVGDKMAIDSQCSADEFTSNIVKLSKHLLDKCNLSVSDVEGVNVTCHQLIDRVNSEEISHLLGGIKVVVNN